MITSETEKLTKEIRSLNSTIRKIPKEYAHITSPKKHLLHMFTIGIVYGLGIIVAFAIVIPLIVFLLQQIEWVPLIGDFVGNVAERVQDVRR